MTRFQRFLYNAALLTLTSLGMRAVGVLFNMYLTAKLGASGLGRFSLIMSVYSFAVTVASSGIHLAVTRVVSESLGQGQNNGMRCAVKTGMLYSVCFGLFSAGLLYGLSSVIGVHWLDDTETIPSLRVLSLSLPFLALSTTINGYFVAVRQAYKGAVINGAGQAVRILVTVLALRQWLSRGAAWSCLALVCGTVVSEIACFLLSMLFFFRDYRGRCIACTQSGNRAEDRATTVYVLKIALPIALTAYIRAGLQTLQHLLIPVGLEKSGEAAEGALASYGTVHGMVLPVLLFPAAFLTAFSGLLIPEVAEFRARGDAKTVERTAYRVLRATLYFSILTAGVMLCYSDALGQLLYDSAEAGKFLRALGALVPVMYLDTMVDALLKGLDEQVASMRYNILDAAFCVVMAYVLLPAFGITGYVMLLYTSELFNLSLSLGKLIAVTNLRFSFVRWVLLPVAAVIGASCCSVLFFRMVSVSFRYAYVTLGVHVMVTIVFYGMFLVLLGCIGPNEFAVCRTLVCGKKTREKMHRSNLSIAKSKKI